MSNPNTRQLLPLIMLTATMTGGCATSSPTRVDDRLMANINVSEVPQMAQARDQESTARKALEDSKAQVKTAEDALAVAEKRRNVADLYEDWQEAELNVATSRQKLATATLRVAESRVELSKAETLMARNPDLGPTLPLEALKLQHASAQASAASAQNAEVAALRAAEKAKSRFVSANEKQSSIDQRLASSASQREHELAELQQQNAKLRAQLAAKTSNATLSPYAE